MRRRRRDKWKRLSRDCWMWCAPKSEWHAVSVHPAICFCVFQWGTFYFKMTTKQKSIDVPLLLTAFLDALGQGTIVTQHTSGLNIGIFAFHASWLNAVNDAIDIGNTNASIVRVGWRVINSSFTSEQWITEHCLCQNETDQGNNGEYEFHGCFCERRSGEESIKSCSLTTDFGTHLYTDTLNDLWVRVPFQRSYSINRELAGWVSIEASISSWFENK